MECQNHNLEPNITQFFALNANTAI